MFSLLEAMPSEVGVTRLICVADKMLELSGLGTYYG